MENGHVRPAPQSPETQLRRVRLCGRARDERSSVGQEGQTAPPAALQFPAEAGANASSEISMRTVRQAIENTVDVLLCKTLMRRDDRPIPEPFTMQNCEPAYAQRVAANSGDVRR